MPSYFYVYTSHQKPPPNSLEVSLEQVLSFCIGDDGISQSRQLRLRWYPEAALAEKLAEQLCVGTEVSPEGYSMCTALHMGKAWAQGHRADEDGPAALTAKQCCRSSQRLVGDGW